MSSPEDPDCSCVRRYPSHTLRGSNYRDLLSRLLADKDQFVPIQGPVDGFNEHYFRCTACGKEWAYIEPDGGYAGYWGQQ